MAGVTGQSEGVSTTNTNEVSVPVPAVAVRPSIRPRTLANVHDALYINAIGDPARAPGWEGGACPALVTWLNAIAPQALRPGARAAVTCCGLGDDAALLVDRGYDVTAFDIAPTAIDWARARHPRAAQCFHTGDLLDPPSKWRGHFDFVVDVNTLCSAPNRVAHLKGVRSLMTSRAILLVICHGIDEASTAPGPLSASTLAQAASEAGLTGVGDISDFEDATGPAEPPRRLRGMFRRASSA